MLHQLPKRPFQLPAPPTPLSAVNTLTIPPPQTDHIFEHTKDYKQLCDLLLSLTRSRSLPKGLQLHAHFIKSGLQSIPLVSHHLINFYPKAQLPLHALQMFDESPHKSATTWSSAISSLAQNELPLIALLELFLSDARRGLKS